MEENDRIYPVSRLATLVRVDIMPDFKSLKKTVLEDRRNALKQNSLHMDADLTQQFCYNQIPNSKFHCVSFLTR